MQFLQDNNKKMKTKLFIFTLCLITMTACSSDNDLPETTGHQQQGGGFPITIGVSETPMTDPNGAGTRAPVTFKETLDHFYMHYITTSPYRKTHSVAYETNTDKDHVWESQSAQWPYGDGITPWETPVYFYAFANVDYQGHDYTGYNYNEGDSSDPENYDRNEQSLNFEIDELSSKQMDLLVAKREAKMLNAQGQQESNTVYFSFQHACAALQFSICKTQALEHIDIELKKVLLHNIKKRGTYFFESGEWLVHDSEGTANPYVNLTLAEYSDNSNIYVPYENADGPNHRLLASNENDFLFVIPQTLDGWTGTIGDNDNQSDPEAYIEIQCKMWQGGTRIDEFNNINEYGRVYLPFAVEWQKGLIYRYNIRMGSNLRYSTGKKIFENS